jgi:hypothetical protein
MGYVALSVEVSELIVISLHGMRPLLAEAGGDHLVADYCNAADRSAVKVGHFSHMAGMSEELFVLGGERKGVD